MKLLSVATAKGDRLAAMLPSGILVFSHAVFSPAGDLSSGKVLPFTLHAALSAKGGLKRLLPRLQAVIDHPDSGKFIVREDSVEIARPFLPRDVLCVGLNYKAHAAEANLPLPAEPLFFAKWTSAMIGPGEPIVLPPDTKEVDYEAELAVVIGQKCRSVPAESALDYVAGYTCVNDVSARDFQRRDRQWSRSKSLDTFGPIGPCLVTVDEIADPQALGIRSFLNGQLMQNANTSDMIFTVRELIAYISRGITLYPGDVISTGTPNGVGFARNPPVFLQADDEIAVEVDGIGRLANPVKAAC